MAKVNVTNGSYTVETVYQYDLNQVLEVYGLSLPTTPEVHFAHDGSEYAIVRRATMDAAGVIRVNVPNSLLQKGQRIHAYICTYEGDAFQTLYTIDLPVKSRNRPGDYTEVEEFELYDFTAMDVEAVTLETGAEATVEKIQRGDKVILRFGLPGGVPGPAGPQGGPGKDGAPFTYDMFTTEQLAALTGPAGADGKDGKDGNSIKSITRTGGTGAPGTTDTYTVTLTDGSTSTFQVYNGADGEGAGDMTAVVYDPQGKMTDVFRYVDDALAAVDANSITFDDGETWQEKYDAGEFTGPAGPAGADGVIGKDGEPGKDGTSVTVASVNESAADGGSNVVTFSDGKTLTVKNGIKGNDGAAGEDGATFTPSVDASGNLSWSNNGGLSNPATVNIKGPAGPVGASTIASRHAATLTTGGWSAGSGYAYTQTVSLSGVTADTDFDVDVSLSGTDAEADALLLEGFGLVVFADSVSGGIKFACATDKPGVNIPVNIRIYA